MTHNPQTPETPIRVFLVEEPNLKKIVIETADEELYDFMNDILSDFENYTSGDLDSDDIRQGIVALAYIYTDVDEFETQKIIEIRLVKQ